MNLVSVLSVVLALVMAPFLLGVINRTKAFFAGRHGAPFTQVYRDIWKLLRKGSAYSRTTTWIFQVNPWVGAACVVCAILFIPTLGNRSLIAFQGDFVLMVYLLGLLRFFLVIAALDTGSSFEGMGASREVTFSAIAEPALLLGMAVLARLSGSMSLSGVFATLGSTAWLAAGPALAVTAVAFLIILLSENSRIPVDDPNTHLELTMIHEVMVLDYSGPDLGMILYSASLKLWIFSALIVNIVLSCLEIEGLPAVGAFAGGMILVAVVVGIIESVMARLRLLTVPRLLTSAVVFSILAFILLLRLS